jgi:hypothetical protein
VSRRKCKQRGSLVSALPLYIFPSVAFTIGEGKGLFLSFLPSVAVTRYVIYFPCFLAELRILFSRHAPFFSPRFAPFPLQFCTCCQNSKREKGRFIKKQASIPFFHIHTNKQKKAALSRVWNETCILIV